MGGSSGILEAGEDSPGGLDMIGLAAAAAAPGTPCTRSYSSTRATADLERNLLPSIFRLNSWYSSSDRGCVCACDPRAEEEALPSCGDAGGGGGEAELLFPPPPPRCSMVAGARRVA